MNALAKYITKAQGEIPLDDALKYFLRSLKEQGMRHKGKLAAGAGLAGGLGAGYGMSDEEDEQALMEMIGL